MQLKPGTKLQGGKIEIIRTLGQGGFGITYEAEQVLLGRKYALKEFFMKDCCERDDATSFVTVGTGSQRNLVEKFRSKFIREARMMAGLDHPNIVRVLDVFEENGTAYYVMENLPGGSLSDKVKKDGPLPEELAEKYIRQVSDALAYIHSQNTVHLDVKPSNILLNAKGDAVLIDFGISKHYDDAGEQTSSTPVGISKGYAPLEQGRDGDISQFKPSTDIYSLGATLYYLVTGSVPPEASIVNEDGLDRPKGISDRLWNVIEQAMQPRRKDRPQSIAAFLSLLDTTEETIVDPEPKPVPKPKPEPKPVPKPKPAPKKQKSKAWLWALIVCAIVAAIISAVVLGGRKEKPIDDELTPPVDTTAVADPAVEQMAQALAPEQVAPGSLKVTSTPSGATIWLDGKNTKKTTPEIIEDLVPGKHSVKLVLDGYNDYSGSITIASGKRAELSQTLKEKEKPVAAAEPVVEQAEQALAPEEVAPGSLKVTSMPSGATIWLDGKNTKKTTPEIIEDLTPGKHSVKLVLDGYNDYSGSITIASGKRAEMTPTLKEKEKPVAIETPVSVEKPTTGSINSHDWVDLGLSVKWATCNVGASSPSDYGSYFAWGETKPKSEYTWSNLRYSADNSGDSFTKYNTLEGYGTVDNKKKLELSDDAARQNWGGSWRMPTDAELTELREKCTWTWTKQGGKNGYKVTSKTNGNSIFLPAAGYRVEGGLYMAGSFGRYWSSSLTTGNPCNAWHMTFDSVGVGRSRYYRRDGLSVRPVSE